MAAKINWKNLEEKVTSPPVIALSIAGGIALGLLYKEAASAIAPLGQIYLNLLKMCILPILISAIVSSIGSLLIAHHAKHHLVQLGILIFCNMCIVWFIAITASYIVQPGSNLSYETLATLGRVISKAEVEETSISFHQGAESMSLFGFLKEMIPENIFFALTNGNNLSIVFFSIMLGLGLGFLKSPASHAAIKNFEAIYEAFNKLIGWAIFGLPLGLFAIFAGLVSDLGLDVPKALIKFILMVYGLAIILSMIYAFIIGKVVGVGFLRGFASVRETLFLAFGTANAFAAIPTALHELQSNLKLDKQSTDLVIPLGATLNVSGNVLFYTSATMFTAQLYGMDIGLEHIPVLLFGSILTAIAAGGLPGPATVGMISIVLDPLGLPSSAIVILLVALDAVLDPICTTIHVHSSCAIAALVAKSNPKDE